MYTDFRIQTANQAVNEFHRHTHTTNETARMLTQHMAAELQHQINTYTLTTCVKMHNDRIVRKWKQQDPTTSSVPVNGISLNKRQHRFTLVPTRLDMNMTTADKTSMMTPHQDDKDHSSSS